MRYFAKLDPQGTVLQVIVTNDDGFIPARDPADTWAETWMDGAQKKNYAGIGFKHDDGRSAFIAPKPYPSWVLDEQKCVWKAPIGGPPKVGGPYEWNENLRVWVVRK